MSENTIKRAILLARTKSLVVQKNSFVPGWCVVLPNKEVFTAPTNKEMVDFVKGY